MDEAMQESTGALVVAIVEDDPRIQQLLLSEIQDEGDNGVIFHIDRNLTLIHTICGVGFILRAQEAN